MNKNNSAELFSLLIDGLWRKNPALVQLLGLCPLLAVSNTAINGITLGLATVVTVVVSNGCVSLTRRWLMQEIRIPVFVLLIAGIVTVTGMLINAWSHELYLTLGIFIPLIITNCAIMARAEIYASRNNVLPSLIDGFAMGAGFALALITLGTVRELIGSGSFLANAHLLFGERALHWTFTLPSSYRGLLVVILPPGAFIMLGLLLALRNLTVRQNQTRTHETLAGEISSDPVVHSHRMIDARQLPDIKRLPS